LWLADITEFATREGKLFLAGIVDVATSQVVSRSMATRATSGLVVDALVSPVRTGNLRQIPLDNATSAALIAHRLRRHSQVEASFEIRVERHAAVDQLNEAEAVAGQCL